MRLFQFKHLSDIQRSQLESCPDCVKRIKEDRPDVDVDHPGLRVLIVKAFTYVGVMPAFSVDFDEAADFIRTGYIAP